MSKNKPSTEHWQPCTGGELVNMVQGQRAVRRSAKMSMVIRSVMATALLIVAVTTFYISRTSAVSSITCDEVCKHWPGYLTNNLDSPELKEKIKIHLAHCQRCRELYAKRSAEKLSKKQRNSRVENQLAFHASPAAVIPVTREDRLTWQQKQWKQILNK